MKVIIPGHAYELVSPDGALDQKLWFFAGSHVKGTSSEEVLAMLIDRIEYLNELLPCDENLKCLEGLRIAYKALLDRTRDRQKRGVKGTQTP